MNIFKTIHKSTKNTNQENTTTYPSLEEITDSEELKMLAMLPTLVLKKRNAEYLG